MKWHPFLAVSIAFQKNSNSINEANFTKYDFRIKIWQFFYYDHYRNCKGKIYWPNLFLGGPSVWWFEQSPAHHPDRRVLWTKTADELLRGRPTQGVPCCHLAGTPAPWAAVPGGGQKVPGQLGAGHRGAVSPAGQGVSLAQDHAAAEMPGKDAPGETPGAQDLHPSETEHLRGHRPLQAATLR